MSKFEAGKEYPLRGGGKAIIDATDRGGEHPIQGATIEDGDVEWLQASWTLRGEFSCNSMPNKLDLMPPEPEIVISEDMYVAFGDGSTGIPSSLAAVIRQWLRENPKAEAAWLEGEE